MSWLQPSYEQVLRQLDACLGQMELAHIIHNKHGDDVMCPLGRTSLRMSVLAHQNPDWVPLGLFDKGWGEPIT
jgi:hypothetical protein